VGRFESFKNYGGAFLKCSVRQFGGGSPLEQVINDCGKLARLLIEN